MDKKKLLAYEESSAHALNWLKSQLNENGNYGESITDLACYYKSPYLFYLSGEIVRANRILNYLKLHKKWVVLTFLI